MGVYIFPKNFNIMITDIEETITLIPTCSPVWWRHRARLAGGWSEARLSATAEHQSRRRSRPGQSSSAGLWGTTSSNVPAPSVNRHCHSYKHVRLWRKPPEGTGGENLFQVKTSRANMEYWTAVKNFVCTCFEWEVMLFDFNPLKNKSLDTTNHKSGEGLV